MAGLLVLLACVVYLNGAAHHGNVRCVSELGAACSIR